MMGARERDILLLNNKGDANWWLSILEKANLEFGGSWESMGNKKPEFVCIELILLWKKRLIYSN